VTGLYGTRRLGGDVNVSASGLAKLTLQGGEAVDRHRCFERAVALTYGRLLQHTRFYR
jgi:hypothetical protein